MLILSLFLAGALASIAACSSGATGTSNGKDAATSQGSGGSGGASAGGASAGGTGGGGSRTGGTTGSGGAQTGGATSSGGATGGQSTGGTVAIGGTATGGISTGGRATGGATGGTTNTGGSATGGTASTGGSATGGATSTGGFGTGGRMTGGATSAVGSGGNATGGATGSGGNATGGAATGGNRGSGGNTGTGGTSASYRPCPTDGSACKIMPFGDSITDGYGIAGGYRVELFRLAHQAGKNITFVGSGSNGPAQVDGVNFPPNHEGHSGFTINTTPSRSGIAPLVSTVMPTYKPHIVTLMIGTNDAIDNYDMGNAPARLGALIDSIFVQLPNVLLVVARPIPSQDDALNLRLQSYGAAVPDVVKARTDLGKHILVVDMYPVIAANPNYKTTLLQDTWHPNSAGYTLLGARWYDMLASSL
jgi:lysophospholipase L1-like esterase